MYDAEQNCKMRANRLVGHCFNAGSWLDHQLCLAHTIGYADYTAACYGGAFTSLPNLYLES